MHRWLNLIGKKNQRLLRRISVIYPAVTAQYDSYARESDSWLRENVWHVNSHLKAIQLSPIPTPLTLLKPYEKPPDWIHRYRKLTKKSDPTCILRSLTELRSLRFVIFLRGIWSPYDYSHGPTDPIHTVD